MESSCAPIGATRFAELVGRSLGAGQFTLVDIGGSGGIDPAWRVFGPRLRAIAFISDVEEAVRLTAAEPLRSVHYVGSALSPDPGFMAARGDRPPLARDPRERLRTARVPGPQPRSRSGGPEIAIQLPKYFEGSGIAEIDMVEAAGAGADLGVLHSLKDTLHSHRVLAVGVEVNVFGSGDATENSFHNVDRMMREQGFELFDLAIRRGIPHALPERDTENQSKPETGRPYGGDALYMRDLCAPEIRAFAAGLAPVRKAKAAAILSRFGLPDSAAEILVTFRNEIASVFDVAEGLALLAEQAQQAGMTDLPNPVIAAEQAAALAELDRQHADELAAFGHASRMEVERLKQELAALRSSTSWRITGPLRRAIRLVRRPSASSAT